MDLRVLALTAPLALIGWASPLLEPTSQTFSSEAGSARLVFGADTVLVELANTQAERERGLMGREAVPDGTGMLFVFGGEASRSFWMENTLVALDIAFMDSDFRIVDIQTMAAMSTDSHTSAAPAQYALEVRAGWFEEKGIVVGDVAEFVPLDSLGSGTANQVLARTSVSAATSTPSL